MAIDTQKKRRAAAAIPINPSPILPDGSFDVADRYAVGWSYHNVLVVPEETETPEKYYPRSVSSATSRYSRTEVATYRPGRAPDVSVTRFRNPDSET